MPKCNSCHADIVWLKTKAGKNMPVDLDDPRPSGIFDRATHTSHFETCPNADRHRKHLPQHNAEMRIVREAEKKI